MQGNITTKKAIPVWNSKIVTLEFDTEMEYRIFSRIARSDSAVAEFMRRMGYNTVETQNLLNSIAKILQRGTD